MVTGTVLAVFFVPVFFVVVRKPVQRQRTPAGDEPPPRRRSQELETMTKKITPLALALVTLLTGCPMIPTYEAPRRALPPTGAPT